MFVIAFRSVIVDNVVDSCLGYADQPTQGTPDDWSYV